MIKKVSQPLMGNGVGGHTGDDAGGDLGEEEADEAGDQQGYASATLQDGTLLALVVLHGLRLTVPLTRNCPEIDVVGDL